MFGREPYFVPLAEHGCSQERRTVSPTPIAAARKLVEIAIDVEAVQDGRIHIERVNGPMSALLRNRRNWCAATK